MTDLNKNNKIYSSENENKCVVCHYDGLKLLDKVRDSSKHHVVSCTYCGHVQLSPLPDPEEEARFYQTNQMDRITSEKNILTDEAMRKKNEIYVEKEIEKVMELIPKDKSILEVGGGYGWFVKKLREKGYHVQGLEINTEKCNIAKDLTGVELNNIDFLDEKLPNKIAEKFDAVCMLHVLEHVLDPVEFVRKAKDVLAPNGIIYVEVPNFHDRMKKLSAAYNSFSYTRAHISYFTHNSLRQVLEKAGYQNVHICADQKYNIQNAIRWIQEGKPNMLNYEFDPLPGLEWIDAYYKAELETKLEAYALIATGQCLI